LILLINTFPHAIKHINCNNMFKVLSNYVNRLQRPCIVGSANKNPLNILFLTDYALFLVLKLVN